MQDTRSLRCSVAIGITNLVRAFVGDMLLDCRTSTSGRRETAGFSTGRARKRTNVQRRGGGTGVAFAAIMRTAAVVATACLLATGCSAIVRQPSGAVRDARYRASLEQSALFEACR